MRLRLTLRASLRDDLFLPGGANKSIPKIGKLYWNIKIRSTQHRHNLL